MCAVKTPKLTPADTATPKPIVIRNPYLDGANPTLQAQRLGRSQLRIDRTVPAVTTTAPASLKIARG